MSWLLIDSERASASAGLAEDRKGFQEKCVQTGIDCHILERRAIEIYFPDAAVKKALGQNFAALGQFDPLSAVSNRWSKRDNWRIAREMRLADLEKTDLGEFLKRI